MTEDDLQGHWRRDWIKTPEFEDGATQVHWLQCGALFADLRIPPDRPDVRGLSCLAEFALPSLKPFLAAEGFAGHITVADSLCTWHRSTNWHGVPGRPDIGRMSFEPSGALVEDGVHAEYRELWQKLPQDLLRAEKVRCGDMSGVLIENDAVFILGIGTPPQGTTDKLRAEIATGQADMRALHALFESEYVLGHWDGPFGVARLSTNPFHEGQVALERKAGFTWHALAFDGKETAHPLVLG